MKLLSKQKVQSQVEDQKRSQIEEGLLLAKKIDALRGKLTDLQHQHDLFVAGMEENLKERTSKMFQEIEIRQAEIKLLEAKRAELLKPLDEEWRAVEVREIQLDNLKTDLEENLIELAGKEKRINDRDKETKEKLSRIKVRERELERTFDKADQLKTEAEKKFLKISEDKDKQDESYYKINKELILREKSIQSYEFTLKQREDHIEQDEQFIKEEKIRLLDQRQTLERAMARIKKV